MEMLFRFSAERPGNAYSRRPRQIELKIGYRTRVEGPVNLSAAPKGDREDYLIPEHAESRIPLLAFLWPSDGECLRH
jgi:hypothetical protein